MTFALITGGSVWRISSGAPSENESFSLNGAALCCGLIYLSSDFMQLDIDDPTHNFAECCDLRLQCFQPFEHALHVRYLRLRVTPLWSVRSAIVSHSQVRYLRAVQR